METEALFWSFFDELEEAIKTRNVEKIRTFLTKALAGAKSSQAKEMGRDIDPLHVLKLVRDNVGKYITNYFVHYENLSEFSHPNAAGLNETYAKIDWEKREIIYGLVNERIPFEMIVATLSGSMECFLKIYDRSAELIGDYVKLCEELFIEPEENAS